MTLPELRESLTYFTATRDVIALTLYVVFQNSNGEEELRIADVEEEAAEDLKLMFLTQLEEQLLHNEELVYKNISESDSRDSIHYYDLEERPEGLNAMNTVLENEEQPEFSFRNDDFERIHAFIAIIGNEQHKLVLFKKHHRLSLLRGRSVFGIRINDHRLERVREDIIKISPTVDFLQIGNALIILKLRTLETGFGFETVIRRKAAQNIEIIAAANLLEDVMPLTLMAENLRSAKKIMRIRPDSPVLLLPPATIIEFVLHHPPIMRKFRTSLDGLRLRLDTAVSKGLFLDLLNDDLLTSELTRCYYVGLGKEVMEVESVESDG